MTNDNDKLTWFQDARFGMFIHWGPYAVQQNGEWSQKADKISTLDYERVADRMTAERFDADAWALAACDAGMKYMVLTSKHHDGFCLWDTRTTGWNAMQHGPHRDVVAEYVAACRRHGLRVGLYWSWVDWHYPEWAEACDMDDLNQWRQPLPDPAAQQRLVDFLHAQISELMTNYGKIDVLWFDGKFLTAEQYRSREMIDMVRRLQPDILINDRSGLTGDFANPEGCLPVEPMSRPWELCHCTHTNWGFQGDDPHLFYPEQELLALLCDSAALGGNMLLNVGPRPDGTLAKTNVAQLAAIGKWISLNGEAIYGTQMGPFGHQPWGVSTRKGEIVYLHVFRPAAVVELYGIHTPIRGARLLDGAAVGVTTQGDRVRLDLPWTDTPLPLVVVLEFAGELVVTHTATVYQQPDGDVLLTANQARIDTEDACEQPSLSLSPDALGGRLLNWRRIEDTASWDFEVEQDGEYIVAIEYNNPDTVNQLTRRLEIRLEDGQSLRCCSPQSGWLHHWGWYRLAGSLRLSAGRHTLTAKPHVLAGGIVLNLRAVRLTPEGSSDHE